MPKNYFFRNPNLASGVLQGRPVVGPLPQVGPLSAEWAWVLRLNDHKIAQGWAWGTGHEVSWGPILQKFVHPNLPMVALRPVWPEVAIKSSPIFTKVSRKSCNSVQDIVSKWPKWLPNIWATFGIKFGAMTFKNSQILSLFETFEGFKRYLYPLTYSDSK